MEQNKMVHPIFKGILSSLSPKPIKQEEVECTFCHGDGEYFPCSCDNDHPLQCPRCKGTGRILNLSNNPKEDE